MGTKQIKTHLVVKLGISASKFFSMYGIWTPSSWTFDLNCNFLSGERTIRSKLLLSVNYDPRLYLVGSSWTSCASISITDDSPVLSRPPLVSAVSVCSINIQIKCQVRMGCGRRRLRRRGIAMPISISTFSIMPLLLVVLCSLPTSIRSRASKQDATLAFWIWVRREPLV